MLRCSMSLEAARLFDATVAAKLVLMTTDMGIFLDFSLRGPCRIRLGEKRSLSGPALVLIRGRPNNGASREKI